MLIGTENTFYHTKVLNLDMRMYCLGVTIITRRLAEFEQVARGGWQKIWELNCEIQHINNCSVGAQLPYSALINNNDEGVVINVKIYAE